MSHELGGIPGLESRVLPPHAHESSCSRCVLIAVLLTVEPEYELPSCYKHAPQRLQPGYLSR